MYPVSHTWRIPLTVDVTDSEVAERVLDRAAEVVRCNVRMVSEPGPTFAFSGSPDSPDGRPNGSSPRGIAAWSRWHATPFVALTALAHFKDGAPWNLFQRAAMH